MSTGTAETRYRECGGCGSYHRIDWEGDCRDDSERLTLGDLPPDAEIVTVEEQLAAEGGPEPAAYWPLREAFGLHKGTLKDKAERHAVFEQPERQWVWEAMAERRSAYTLAEVRGMGDVVFTSSDLATVENPEDYHRFAVRAAERAEAKHEELTRRVAELKRVDAMVAELGRAYARQQEMYGGRLDEDDADSWLSFCGATHLRNAGYGTEEMARLDAMDRELLVRAVRETARHVAGEGAG